MPDNHTVTLGSLQREMGAQLQAAGIGTAKLDARLLLQHAIGKDHAHLVGHYNDQVPDSQLALAQAVLARRLAFEPVSRIVGCREFYGLEFAITPDVLDPRPDSEVLVDAALQAGRLMSSRGRGLAVAEAGVGSGALIISVLMQLCDATAIASDVSPAALRIARDNAVRWGVDDRLKLVRCSWLDGVEDDVDLIISNPPYIKSGELERLSPDVRNYDPVLALDGGDDGLVAYRSLVPAAYAKLRDGGGLCVEVGAGQANGVWTLFERSGFRPHGTLKTQVCDLAGHVRVVRGWKTQV